MLGIAIFHAITLICLGVCITSCTLGACQMRKKQRVRWDRFFDVSIVVVLVWCIPSVLWYRYPPLTICTPRLVYSHGFDTARAQIWESFWCSRPCVATIVRPSSLTELQQTLAQWSSVRVV